MTGKTIYHWCILPKPYTVKKVSNFPVPSWDVTTKLSLAEIILNFLQCMGKTLTIELLFQIITRTLRKDEVSKRSSLHKLYPSFMISKEKSYR
jgi:hypothetical protein